MTTYRHAALIAALMWSPACVTNVYYVEADEGTTNTEDTGVASFPGWNPDADTSTGEPASDASTGSTGGADESTGSHGGSTTAADLSTGDSTTSADEASTSGTTDGSTSDVSTSGSTGDETTTDEPPPPGKAPGEVCGADEECESGHCTSSSFDPDDAPHTCTITCTVDVANSCGQQGAPGVCITGGGDKLYCSGSWKPATGYFITPETEPPNLIQWAGNTIIAADAVQVSLVPSQPYPYKLTTGFINNVGWGAAALDVYDHSGAPLGTVEPGGALIVGPTGKHTLIIARPIEGKKAHYDIYINTAN